MNRQQFVEHALRNDLAWVPTTHNLSTVLNLYLKYLNNNNNDVGNFETWLATTYLRSNGEHYAPTTAHSYCFPFEPNEFDLWHFTMQDIEVLAAGGPGSLIFWRQRRRSHVSKLVCLNDARLVGILNSISSDSNERENILIEANYAGTDNAARNLISVGLSVGKHFGLLDNQGLATEFFEKIFGSIEDGSALNTFL